MNSISTSAESQHCCVDMNFHLEAGELHISYIPKFREYGIDYRVSAGSGRQIINYCPWCGAVLPLTLRIAWNEELERLGLEPDDELPSNMLTDQWWLDQKTRKL